MSEILTLVAGVLEEAGVHSQLQGGQLVVDVHGDPQGETLEARKAYVTATQIAETMHLLMCSVEYPYKAKPETLDAFRLASHEITQWLMLGGIQTDDDGSTHFRYSMVVDDDAPPSAAALAQLWGLVDYQQMHYGDYLDVIQRGNITIDGLSEFIATAEADDDTEADEPV